MKGMFRLALLSYAVAVVTSAPALAMQEPGIAPARLVAVSASALDRSASVTSPSVSRERPLSAAAPRVRLRHASAEASETLAVAVRGPVAVRSSGLAGYRAAVANAAGSSRYYFWWFTAACARRIGCAPSSYTLVAEGLGRDSVDVAFGTANAEKDVVVQVAEVDGGRTGSSPMFVTLGPAQRPVAATASARASCDWFAGSFYPHTGDYRDPRTGRTWERKFRRDYCGNRVQWDPER